MNPRYQIVIRHDARARHRYILAFASCLLRAFEKAAYHVERGATWARVYEQERFCGEVSHG